MTNKKMIGIRDPFGIIHIVFVKYFMIHDLLSGAAFMMNIFDQISKFKASAWSTFLNKIYMSKANKNQFRCDKT